MVHARAFSFTDDATNVGWPRPSSFSRRASITGQMLSGSEPAFLLFQLRRAQSHWYQALFQSDPTPLPDSSSFIWQMCQEMKVWAEALPGSLPVGMRALFDLEVRYSFVYCIAPSARAPHMTDYGRLLIFEHAIAYLDRIYEISHSGVNTALYSYHDALRVFFMASQFVAVLRDAGDVLLSGLPIQPPPSTTAYGARVAPQPLPLPSRPGGPHAHDNLERSIACLERTTLTLARYGERWDDSVTLQRSYEAISAEVLDRLRLRRQLKHQQQQQQHQQHQQHQQQQHQQHQQRGSPPQGLVQAASIIPQNPGPGPGHHGLGHGPGLGPAREMRWVGVDVQAMMRANNAGAAAGARNVKFEH